MSKKLIIFVLAIAVLEAGFYFKDDVINFYDNAKKELETAKKANLGSSFEVALNEIKKEVFSPAPLETLRNVLNGQPAQDDVILTKNQIITETNIQRRANGLPILKENVNLNQAASAKAVDMFKNQYFEHVSPTGIDPGKLVQSNGYDYITTGENLILGRFSSEKEVVDNWMASPGHRENILNSKFTEIGVAMVKGTYKGQVVWIGVQEFGRPLSSCPEPSKTLLAQIELEKAELNALSLQIDEKKEQIDSTNSNSAVYRQMVDDYNSLVVQYNQLAEKIKQEVADYNNQINGFNACINKK